MFDIERKQVDSIVYGDTNYRLMESAKGHRIIESYSMKFKRWNITSRHNVNTNWKRMKVLYESMEKRRNQD